MALKGLSDIFKPEDSDIEEYEEKETSKGSKGYKNKTILVEPRAFSEAQQIADYLKEQNQVVVNFKRVTSDVSKRIMDFLNGIIYAIEGSMQKLGPGIVICAPKGFEIEGTITEDERKKSTKKDDLGEW
ncbi:cell division protein sepF [Clostridium sp. CAG:1000]|nr:cell division protein SepF [Clostridium sp.]CCX36070.1 cell division protein sepF [Clostridium sp. CAG:1000]